MQADITGMGMFGNDSVVTIGTMQAMATHNRHPGDTLRADLADRAAPVAVRALFSPASEGERDTLTVTFSEPLVASVARPFVFQCGETGTTYSMVLQNLSQNVAQTHSFIVSAIENADGFPGLNDSLWISTEVIVSDTNANIQSNENNRRVKLSIKPAPLAIKVIPAPNPFTPGARGADGQTARIIVRPTSKSMGELNLRGTINIHDRLSNLVASENLERCPNSPPDLIYLWDGRNRKGRRVGEGTYLITVTVEHVQEEWEEKVKPVKGRALMYLRR